MRKIIATDTQLRRWVAAGESNMAIAARCRCSEKHVRNVLRRAGITRTRRGVGIPFVAAPDAERDLLAADNCNEARANAIFARRFAEVRARRDEKIDALVIGEDDAADELERRLRREGRVA